MRGTKTEIPHSVRNRLRNPTQSPRGAEAASLAWREAWRSHASFRLMRSLAMLGTAQEAGLPRSQRSLAWQC